MYRPVRNARQVTWPAVHAASCAICRTSYTAPSTALLPAVSKQAKARFVLLGGAVNTGVPPVCIVGGRRRKFSTSAHIDGHDTRGAPVVVKASRIAVNM